MAKINLPKDVLQKEAFRSFPAKEKEEYMSSLLKKILELNPDGITISQIKEATGLTYSTLWHHLEILSCTAQCHKVSHGNSDVYHATGKSTHLNDYAKGKVQYSIEIVEDKEGRFVCMHEKRENRTGNPTICTGIQIPFELIDNLIKDLSKIKK